MSESFWLKATVKIVAQDETQAKEILDRALRSESWMNHPERDEGILYFDRTGLVLEETK